MRRSDAPPAGWYPDPQHRLRLRWWDGLDWTEIRRAPPSDVELTTAEENREFFEKNALVPVTQAPRPGAVSQQDASQIIAEVRNVARQEIDRAAQEFSHRADTAVRSVTPLISQYTNQFKRWFRLAMIIATFAVIAYFLFQVVAQASFFNWLGDRIDNLNEESIGTMLALSVA
jgi:hypothetical protein